MTLRRPNPQVVLFARLVLSAGLLWILVTKIGASWSEAIPDPTAKTFAWLAGALVLTAGAFVLLRADLLATIQIVLYTGGVVTLMLFAVLLTWKRQEGAPTIDVRRPVRGAIPAVAFFVLAASAIQLTEIPSHPLAAADAAALGELFLGRHVLPFEALSVLLLAVMVGAIVIARRDDAGGARRQSGSGER